MDIPEDSFAGLDDIAEEAAEAPVKAQTADALGEAEIYIAYGKFNQAAELLQNAINEEPQRTDLQLKLLEVMAELGDRDGFQRQENDLLEIGGVSAQIDQVKAKYPAMAAASVAAVAAASAPADLDEFTLDDLEPEPVSAVSEDLDNSFDLSLDDLDSDIEAEIQSPAPVSEENLDEFSLDFDLDTPTAATTPADDMDFDLSLDELGGEAGSFATETTLKLDDDLSDFNLELESELSAAVADEAELSLSLDDDLAFEAPVVSAAGDIDSSLQAEPVLTSDFDLSLADENQPLEPIADEFDAQLDVVHAELDQLTASIEEPQEQLMPEAQLTADTMAGDDEDDFDFLSGTDETATKLDLARAYIDMGDAEGARDILDEVVAEGNEAQQQEARDLIGKLV
jgi:pilus assembly protein FimV